MSSDSDSATAVSFMSFVFAFLTSASAPISGRAAGFVCFVFAVLTPALGVGSALGVFALLTPVYVCTHQL